MAKQKVRLADNIARVIFVDPDATNGATLDSNLFMRDGRVATPLLLRQYLGIGGANGTLLHKELRGLQQGDDHPQYTMWADKEQIKGQWNFVSAIWGADGTAALPEFTFTDDTNTGMYRVGADNIGLSTGGTLRWDINTERVRQDIPLRVVDNDGIFVENENVLGGGIEITVSGVDTVNGTDGSINFWELPGRDLGFRFFLHGAPVDEAYLRIYAHNDDPAGLEMMNFQRTTGDISVLTRLLLPNGSAANPSLTFSSDGALNTGLFWAGENLIGFATAAGERMTLGQVSLTLGFGVQLRGDGGSAAAPGYSFSGGTNAGMFRSGTSLAFATVGVERLRIGQSTIPVTIPFLQALGTAGGPSYSFTGDQDTGIYSPGANELAFTTGGTRRLSISTTAFSATLPWRGQDGTAAAPAFSFSGDTDTGIYRVGADQMGIAAGGTVRWDINTARVSQTVPLYGPQGSAGTPTFSFGGDPNTGIFNQAADAIGVATNGGEVARFDADATAGNTRFMLYDVDTGTLARVSVGPADSGGAGFKYLRVPN